MPSGLNISEDDKVLCRGCCHTCCSLEGRSPNKILFSQTSGKIWQTDLVPLYDKHGLLERNEPVPFRLTRNLVAFLSMFGVDGLFVTAMVCAAQVLPLPLQEYIHSIAECHASSSILTFSKHVTPAMSNSPPLRAL